MPEHDDHCLVLSDASEGLRGLHDGSVDCIVTDPAYSSTEPSRAQGGPGRKHPRLTRWFDTVPDEYFEKFFEECHRVLRKNGVCYCFSSPRSSWTMGPAMEAAGFREVRELCWHKVGSPGMGYPYRSCHEVVLYGSTGKILMPADRGVSSVLRFPRVHGGFLPCEKPVDLLRVLLQQASLEPDSLIVDPFAGSGSTGEAAYLEGHRFLGFDVDERAVEHFHDRRANWVREDGTSAYDGTQPNILDLLVAR